ncbi:MAG: hypothetical protein AMXMBFR7_42130 [Planctomycetota bacterium]
MPTRTDRRSGFTLVEVLIAVAIVVLLGGLLLAVLGRIQKSAREAATQTLLDQLGASLVAYQLTPNGGTFPLSDSSPADLWSGGVEYLEVEAAPFGAKSTGVEANGELVNLLKKQTSYTFAQKNLRDGVLVDEFGHPVVVRFFVLPPPPGRLNGNLREVGLVFSYGPNGINETRLTPGYVHQGPPLYDQEEFERARASAGDDLRNWVQP